MEEEFLTRLVSEDDDLEETWGNADEEDDDKDDDDDDDDTDDDLDVDDDTAPEAGE